MKSQISETIRLVYLEVTRYVNDGVIHTTEYYTGVKKEWHTLAALTYCPRTQASGDSRV